MMRSARCLLGALILTACLCPAVRADDADGHSEWMSVLLDGRKIGHVEHQRRVAGDTVTTRDHLVIELARSGTPVVLDLIEQQSERLDGQPLGFEQTVDMSGGSSRVVGTVAADGTLTLTTTGPAGERSEQQRWPEGALLGDALDRLQKRHGLAPGTQFQARMYEVSSQAEVPVSVRVHGPEPVVVGTETLDAVRVDETVHSPGADVLTRRWVDADYRTLRSDIPMFGTTLTMLAVDRAAALAPNQPPDLMERTMTRSPVRLAAPARTRAIDYTLRVAADQPKLPDTDEQQVRPGAAGELLLTVAPTPTAEHLAAPVAADTAATRWLEVDAGEIRALAADHQGDGDAGQRMQHLRDFVASYISDKTLAVGYATALETAQSRRGDCTEHAVLLAALGRAAGIPTRVVSGVAYADAYAGKERVFVPHAWVVAFVDGHWRSYDAALAGFDSGHIAFAVDNGDPAAFYAGLNWLGRLQIKDVEVHAR
jgi:hypothetical protein